MQDEKTAEALERPDSLLTPRVRKVLLDTLRSELDKAVETGDDAYMVELQKARKLVNKGCWTVRTANPYIEFMQHCMLGKSNGTLESTQQAMKQCAEEWRNLPEDQKKTLKKEKRIYDYL